MILHKKKAQGEDRLLFDEIEYHEIDGRIFRRIKRENGQVYWQRAHWTSTTRKESEALDNIRQENNRKDDDPLKHNIEYQQAKDILGGQRT